jgi:hypothetical protein
MTPLVRRTTSAVPREKFRMRIRIRQSNPVWFLIALMAACGVPATAQEPTPQERQAVARISTTIDRAGKYFNAEKIERSRDLINTALKQVGDLSIGARRELIDLIRPEYARLRKAHQLLSERGQKLEKLAPLPEPMGAEITVSFTKNVAPTLVAKCGNCHVNRNRGNFSIANFQALDQSTAIARGLPQDSRLIEVIETGEMPKGGLKVERDELEMLQRWIKQGAKFDGENPQSNLNEFVEMTSRRSPGQPERPNGNETISFGKDVAPILIEHCGQCHIVPNNPRGNLNLRTFRGLLVGGDSGAVISPGKSSDSPLFTRVELGEMPPDRKLESKVIRTIGKWIDEGAKFDGQDPRTNLMTIAAKAKADSQTHAELVADRKQKARRTWQIVMSGIEGTEISSQNFLIVGAATESRLAKVSELVESLVPKISKTLRIDKSRPLVKGNISVFVFDKRYDFSEFGKMIEELDFPKQISGYWAFDTVNAYTAILAHRNRSVDELTIQLTRQIVALHTASLTTDVPRWFADGLGYWTAKKIFPRDDQTRDWDSSAQAAAATMKQPDDFMQSKMPADQAALVGYLFVKELKSDSSKFNRLMNSLRDGETFDSSFSMAFGISANEMIGVRR